MNPTALPVIQDGVRRFGNATPSSLSGARHGAGISGLASVARARSTLRTGRNLAAAGFPGRRVLDSIEPPKTTKLAGDPCVAGALRQAFEKLDRLLEAVRFCSEMADPGRHTPGLRCTGIRTGDRASAAAAVERWYRTLAQRAAFRDHS